MRDFLHHILFPRESNNHRAKILHHSSLFLLIALLFVGQLGLSTLKSSSPTVLGVTSNISAEELLRLTNLKRQEAGLSHLILNQDLISAASSKADHMFVQNYWAHNSPDGTTPWVFVKGSGYDYLYAGENLARGFTSSQDVVDAWMASPGHRENLLSENYNDIGFAIKDGTLTGSDTILVVQIFGSQRSAPSQVGSSSTSDGLADIPDEVEIVAQQPIVQEAPIEVAAVQTTPLIDAGAVSRTLPLTVLGVLLGVLLLDLVLIERRKIVRVVSHNLDHIIFLIIIGFAVVIVGRGVVI